MIALDMENWKEHDEVFKDFNEEVTQTWINNGFTKETAQEWLEIRSDFTWQHSSSVTWLWDQQKITPQQWTALTIEQKKELNNKCIEYCQKNNFHFCTHCYQATNKNLMFFSDRETNLDFCSERCQLVWFGNDNNKELLEWRKIDKNLTLINIQACKKINFTLADYQKYLKLNDEDKYSYKLYTLGWEDVFSWEQFKALKLNLSETGYSKISYWKEQNILPHNQTELNKLLEKGIPAQYYLDWMYPTNDIHVFSDKNQGKSRSEITKLAIIKMNLTGTLDLSNFINLEVLNYSNNQITELILPKHNWIKKINSELEEKIVNLKTANENIKQQLVNSENLNKILETKLTEAYRHIEKMEREILSLNVNSLTISRNPKVITEDFQEFTEERRNPQWTSDHHPQSIIYRNPQVRLPTE